MKTRYIMYAVVLGAVALVGFFVGTQYQQKRSGTTQNMGGVQGNFQRRNGQGGGFSNNGTNAANRFRPVTGEVINSDEKSVTVKLPDGSTKLVFLSDSTPISKSSEASRTDIQNGSTVMVIGTQNSDGSITAQNVDLNPRMRTFGSAVPVGSPRP